jgi:sigma-B regulation protein RsbU (phosphoserine phosphatase)
MSGDLTSLSGVEKTFAMELSRVQARLAAFSIFKDFDVAQLEQLLHSCTLRTVQPGEVLIHQDRENDTLFVLVEGQLEIVIESKGTEIAIPILPGECLGEMSIVMNEPTSALAKGQQQSTVLCIPDHVFWAEIMMTRNGARNMMGMMAERLKRSNMALIKEVEEQLRYKQMEKELETAGKIQSSIVPNGAQLLPHRAEVDAYATINQAHEVGGDFFDVVALESEKVYFAIGDVSGKGMSAALLMVRIFTSLRTLINNDLPIDVVVRTVNNLLVKKNEDMRFVTLFAGVLDLRTGLLRYVNGGHNPPFIAKGGEGFQVLPIGKNPMIGIQHQTQFAVTEIQLEPGDTIMMYTDGIPEATDKQGAMFEMDRMQSVLEANDKGSMADMVKALEAAVEQFVTGAPQYDDFTMLALRYLGWAPVT